MATTHDATPHKLTARGQATRARILEHAAEMVYAHGVQGTNNEQLRQVARVSGSQLNHYFPDKESLVLAVIAWQADRVLSLHTSERFAGFQSIDALRDWAEHYITYERAYQEGCSLGSLASEIIKTGLDVHDRLAREFDKWTAIFRSGLARMREHGTLRAEADPAQLAHLLLSAFQGGMLLAQIAGEITPLRDALTAAIDHVQSFAAPTSL